MSSLYPPESRRYGIGLPSDMEMEVDSLRRSLEFVKAKISECGMERLEAVCAECARTALEEINEALAPVVEL